MALVKLDRISKVYQSEELKFQALEEISLEIETGEFVAVTGPSGSGKSTLMHIFGLLDSPTSGTYLLNGKDTAHLGENSLAALRNKEIGFVFQSFNLLGRTSALHNVALPLVYAGVEPRERELKAKKMLEQVGLGDKLPSLPNQLSGGQQQRVAVARALVGDPSIILADEPTGNLDTKSGAEVMALFKKLHREGKTIVLITHDQSIAEHANRIIHLKDGRVV